MDENEKAAILVGGGPAPGINSVIGAAAIRYRVAGVRVLGIRDGFRWLMQGDDDHVVPLRIEAVSRIHFRGGSQLGTSRANPTRDPAHLRNVVETLHKLGVSQLITIGGDDTAYSAMMLSEAAGGWLRVVHVPKTIDNDLALPATVDTFGFQTARHLGVQIVQNLMVDADTTSRWYFAIAMGRKAGHLALGIGKAAGATITLIPEEFGSGPIRLREVVDTLVGAIIKRLARGEADGVAVIAEGVVLGSRMRTSRISTTWSATTTATCALPRSRSATRSSIRSRNSSRRWVSRPRSWPRTSATSCGAPTRSRSTWSTRATSGIAR